MLEGTTVYLRSKCIAGISIDIPNGLWMRREMDNWTQESHAVSLVPPSRRNSHFSLGVSRHIRGPALVGSTVDRRIDALIANFGRSTSALLPTFGLSNPLSSP